MSPELILLSVVSVCLVFGLLSWRLAECIRSFSGSSFRERSDERRGYLHLIEKLVEKKDVPVADRLELSHIHGRERMNEVNADARVAQTAEEGKKNNPIPGRRVLVSTSNDKDQDLYQ